MFENMWHTRGVGWVGLEADAEDVVRVVTCYMEIVGSCLVVLEMQGRQLELGYMLRALEGEAMETGAGLW